MSTPHLSIVQNDHEMHEFKKQVVKVVLMVGGATFVLQFLLWQLVRFIIIALQEEEYCGYGQYCASDPEKVAAVYPFVLALTVSLAVIYLAYLWSEHVSFHSSSAVRKIANRLDAYGLPLVALAALTAGGCFILVIGAIGSGLMGFLYY